MKKIILTATAVMITLMLYSQENVAIDGSIGDTYNIENAGNAIDGDQGSSAFLTSGSWFGDFEIVLDKVYNISSFYLYNYGHSNNEYHIYFSETTSGNYGSTYGTYTGDVVIENINETVGSIRIEAFRAEANYDVNILEVEVMIPTATISFGYDNAGNRTSRTIVMQGTKSGKMEGEMDPFEDKTSEGLIQIFPNPTEGQLAVKLLDFESLENARIQIFDLTGKRVYDNLNIRHSNFIDLSDAAIGTYIMKIKVGESIHEWKIIKE